MAMYQQWSFGIAPNQDKSWLTLMYLTKPGFVAKPCITVSQTHFDTTFIYTQCYMNYKYYFKLMFPYTQLNTEGQEY